MKDIKNELVNEKHRQERVDITVEKITKQCSKIPNWKVPVKGAVQGY